jgi:hypothetical protein
VRKPPDRKEHGMKAIPLVLNTVALVINTVALIVFH